MAATVPCPKCRKPLEVPKPMPDKIRCPSCGALIKKGRRPGEDAKVPAGAAAEGVTARRPGATSSPDERISSADSARRAKSDPRSSDEAGGSNTGLKVGIAAVVLLLAIGGGVAAWVILGEPAPKPVVVEKEVPKEKEKEIAEKPGPDESGPKIDFKVPPPAKRPAQLLKELAVKREALAAASEDDKEKLKKEVDDLQKQLDALKAPVDPRITKAVEEGVRYLRSKSPAKDPNFADGEIKRLYSVGAAALIGLTLLECDAGPDDADVKWIADFIRASAAQLDKTYTIAPAILFLDRLHKPGEGETKDKTLPEDRKLIETLALRLILAQMGNGLWDYTASGFGKGGLTKTEVTEESLLAELKNNTYQPHGGGSPSSGDISNTQFAALALWAAQRHDVPVKPALRAAAKVIRENQDKSGGWGYKLTGPTAGRHKDTGTCVGLILLALGRAAEEDGAKKGPLREDPKVAAGLKYLSKIVHKDWKAQPKEPGKFKAPLGADSLGDLYFLWSLERMSLILGEEKIDDVDWHPWGAEILLANQLPDGSWKDLYGVSDTCFALLFLKQANLFKDLTDKLQSAMHETSGPQLASAPPPARRNDQ
jgi:hypothetical protein